MEHGRPALQGLRILLVEDNFLAAEVVSDMLASNGCIVVGPVGRVEDGLHLAADEALDGAVLDVNLGGEHCYPIAQVLRERHVPFLFLTGYEDLTMLPSELRTTPRIGKPVLAQDLVAALRAISAPRSDRE